MRRTIAVLGLAGALLAVVAIGEHRRNEEDDEIRALLLEPVLEGLITSATTPQRINPLSALDDPGVLVPLPATVCISVDGDQDPSPRLVRRLASRGFPAPIVPLSSCKEPKHYAISKIERGGKRIRVHRSMECGPLCSGGGEYFFERGAQGWIMSSGLQWAS